MTLGQAKEATGATAAHAEKFLPYLSDVCARYAINTPVRQLCFFAQVGHESGGLYYTEELATGDAYEGRRGLGNTQPGDGRRFKGRGLIQLTGRTNYQCLSAELKVDLLASPTLLGGKNADHCTTEQLRYATLSAGWFWNRNGLNKVADQIQLNHPIDEGTNLDAFRQLTRRINGGYNGLPDRLFRYRNGLKHMLEV